MRFPIKGTVFIVIFLLRISFFGYLQPALAENTVAFKMVILPAKKIVLEDVVFKYVSYKKSHRIVKPSYKPYSLINTNVITTTTI
ncbi:MAG TPA: hypothetical protein PKL88_02855 [bacterium]|jgi:hypothetical protein|nr:hypothetical protein [Patescibacteria group bacterium]HNU76629.1 hypothetical protein [bacterium]